MAKKSSGDSGELNLDSLMDAVTNVVGVLMIVFVMVSLQVARTVSKILSDLPPVTPEELVKKQEEAKKIPPPIKTPEQVQEEKKLAEQEIKKFTEQLSTVDLTELQQKMKFLDLDELRKQIEARRKERDQQKTASDKLIAEVERLKALLDQTPVYQPPPPTYVRLPNPRPYPEKPVETRVMVAKEGVIFYREDEYLQPLKDGLESIKSQLEYKEVKIDPFMPMLEKILGSKAEAQKAWAEIAPLVDTVQMDAAANAYKTLAAGGVAPTKEVLRGLADVAVIVRQTLPDVAEAVAAAAKGDVSKWVAMDPAKPPAAPIIKASRSGNKMTFSWGSKTDEVRFSPRDVAAYFSKTLADFGSFKNASRARTIYDAFKVVETLKRAANNQIFTKAFNMTPAVRPGLAYVQLALAPRAGGGIPTAQLAQPNSEYIRALRAIKNDPNGVALFLVMPDAFTTYLEARRVADEVGVPAAWDFLRSLELTANVTGFEVQRFTEPAAARRAAAAAPGVTIAPPKRTLD